MTGKELVIVLSMLECASQRTVLRNFEITVYMTIHFLTVHNSVELLTQEIFTST